MSHERVLYQKSFPSNNVGLVYTFEKVMEKFVAESPDLKKLEKQFKKQLNEIEVDKEMLETQLKNKNTELNQLHMQYRDKEEHFDRLEHEKRTFERQLELEVITNYNLRREVDNLTLAKKKLEIYIDHLQMKE